MKKIINIIAILLSQIILAQNELPQAKINVYARYQTAKGIELVFLSNKKQVLSNAMQNGFVIERADANTNHFVEIARQKAFLDKQWIMLINQTTNQEKKKRYQAGYSFYKALQQSGSQQIDFNNGVAKLKEAKKQEDMKLLMMLLLASKDYELMKAMGLTYLDTNIQVGKTYKYRVKLAQEDPVYQVKSKVFTVEASNIQPDYKHLFYVKQQEKQLSFVWNEIPGLQGFDIERAETGTKHFVKCNKAPIYTMSGNGDYVYTYVDKNLTNYKKYTYRFYANNFFGERVKLFEMTTFPVDKTPPPEPNIQKPEHIAPNEVRITWKIKPVADLKGFVVARSALNSGKFKILHDKLLSKSQRKFIDRTFDKKNTNYYVVQAIDTAGNISSSVPFSVVLIDTIPPAKPKIATATIDSLGHVVIKLKPNTEKDLMGYRLFKANDPKHEFSQIRNHFLDSVTDPKKNLHIFRDTTTLNTLTPNIYYRVKALDFHYNQSEFSDIYIVKRPDTIPPTVPVFNNVKVFTDKVVLQFAPSQSEDVVANYLYRKTDLHATWKLLTEIKNNQTEFVDKNVQKEVKYFYSMRAKDNSGLYSAYSETIYAIPYDDKIRPSVTDFELVQKDKHLILKWKYPVRSNQVFFVIYKSDVDGNLVQYKRTNNTIFEDNQVASGAYLYAIKAFTEDGGESKMSEIKSIDIKP